MQCPLNGIPINRRVYSLSNTEFNENQTILEVAVRVPNGVICLISALRFHGLTTQNPFEVWIAIEPFRIDYTRYCDIQEDQTRAVTLALLAKDLPSYTPMRTKDSVLFQRRQGGTVIKQLVIYPKFDWAADTHQPSDVVDASRGKLRLEIRLWRKGLAGIKRERFN